MWRPRIEVTPRSETNKLQEERLKRQLRHVYENSLAQEEIRRGQSENHRH